MLEVRLNKYKKNSFVTKCQENEENQLKRSNSSLNSTNPTTPNPTSHTCGNNIP